MPSHAPIALADVPGRRRLVALRSRLELLRDEIADLDESGEATREALAEFEREYRVRLREPADRLARLRSLIGHIERWTELLRRAPPAEVGHRARRLDSRRDREAATLFQARRAGRDSAPADDDDTGGDGLGRGRRLGLGRSLGHAAAVDEETAALKAVYRRLVRRYHPDLARTEAERLRSARLMHRIVGLYRAGDRGRLDLLEEQLHGDARVEELAREMTPLEQAELVAERVAWLERVAAAMREELEALSGTAVGQLWQRYEEQTAAGRDVFADLSAELEAQAERMLGDISWSIEQLELAVRDYNKEEKGRAVARRERGDSPAIFDPFADKGLVRLGLRALGTMHASRAAERQAQWVRGLAEEAPAQLYLLLLAHVCQLSALPLPGLERYEDVRIRFDSLLAAEDVPPSLEQTLAELSDIVEYGVRRATPELVHLSLDFRHEATREAMPLAVEAAPVRAAFREVLHVLGEPETCAGCGELVFSIPLFRTRGLDDLRATVCPECGHAIRRYYMPMGDDVQAILNQAYVDLDLITDWSFSLARTNLALQLLPVEVSRLTVGDLKRRLVDDLFRRYKIGVTRGHLRLLQEGRRVRESTPLEELTEHRFTLELSPKAPLREPEAVQLLRHRIRHRFQ